MALKQTARYALTATLLLLGSTAPALAQEKIARLTSLEWPPYSGAALKDGGASVAVAKAAFAAVGWQVEVRFLPWKRAVDMVRDGQDRLIGYFPEYLDETITEFSFSASMGNSPLGLMQQKAAPVSWNSIADLVKIQPVGVVDGYVNTPELDAAIADGSLKADTVSDDSLNIRKVAAGRIKAAVIDKNVMDWFIRNDAALKGPGALVSFNDKLLATKTLHIAFRKSPDADAARAAFNEGLGKITIDKIMGEHVMSQLHRPAGLLLAAR